MAKQRKTVRRNRREEAGVLALRELRKARLVLSEQVAVIQTRAIVLDTLDTHLIKVIAECGRIAKGEDAVKVYVLIEEVQDDEGNYDHQVVAVLSDRNAALAKKAGCKGDAILEVAEFELDEWGPS